MFSDRLKLALTLAIGGESFAVASGGIERADVVATRYGFDAEIAFYVSSETAADALFASFSTSALQKATLTVANGRVIFADAASEPLTLTGYVTHRRVREVTSRAISGKPIVGRHYVIRFADPAQALWRPHRPIELYVDTSMKDVIDLHKAQGMTITYDWAQLGEALDVLCVGLGGEQDASFYDFVIWYLHENHGVLELDPGTCAYRIGKTKARGGESLDVDLETVAELRLLGPAPPRFATTVLNPSTEAAIMAKPLTNDQSTTGVRAGAFAHTLLAAKFDQRVQIEGEWLVSDEHRVEIIYKAAPEHFRPPGQIMVLGDAFSRQLYPSGKKYRAIEIRLRARRIDTDDGEADVTSATAPYEIDLRAELELSSDPTPRLPPFARPRYPVMVEGRVLSASGQDADRTFHALEGEKDSLFRYRVHVPLWNKTVVAPFVPGGLTGHFFFPAFKNQRVLMALDFSAARISSFLEWAGKLPKDTQGDQLVLGWNDTNETIMSHVYEDNKPVLRVARRLEGDTETLTVSEGTIRMVVKEEEVAPKATPSYDVTPNVDAAKARTNSEVRGAVSGVTGQFESSMGDVTGSIDGARGEVDAALSSSEATLTGKIGDAEGQLSALSAGAQQSADQIGTAAGGAKADIKAALEE